MQATTGLSRQQNGRRLHEQSDILQNQLHPCGKQAVAALLSLLEWAEKQGFKLPADLSEKHDKYLWEKSEQEK
jgi:hypothetical protein